MNQTIPISRKRHSSIPQDVIKSKPKEAEMFQWIASKYPYLNFYWNPTRYKIDWVVTDSNNKPVAWMEAKYRLRYKLNEFNDLVVNLDKWMYGVEVSDKTGVPFTIIQADSDGRYWTYTANKDDITKGKIFIKRDGRSKYQRDWQDLDVFVHIPNYLWTDHSG